MRNPVHVCVRLKRSAAGGVDPQRGAGTKEGRAPPEGAVNTGADAGEAATRHEVPTKLQNFYMDLPAPRKLAFLKDFLVMPEVRQGKTIVFFLTCACVDYFYSLLRELVDNPEASHDQKNKKRQKHNKK